MKSIFKKTDKFIYSPVCGTAQLLSGVKDESFAKGVMGKGVAISPLQGKIYAPCDAEVEFVMPHAVSLCATNGAALLIHIGIDTVSLDGRGFKSHIKEGERVKRGQPLITADISVIEGAGLDSTVMITVCNWEEFPQLLIMPCQKVGLKDALIDLGDKL